MKREQRTVVVSVRIRPEERDRLNELVKILSEGLGTEVTRAQAFNVAVKEALEKRRSDVSY